MAGRQLEEFSTDAMMDEGTATRILVLRELRAKGDSETARQPL